VKTKKQAEPYILVIGSYKDPTSLFLIIDCNIVCEIKLPIDAILALLSAYFVFNICYVKGLSNVFTFLKHAIFSLKHKKSLQLLVDF